MKKEKMVTRTIAYTVANVKFFDMIENSVRDRQFTIVGKLSVSEVEEQFNARYSNVKFIMLNSMDYIEKLFGMPESVFLANATELPPRKNNETQED